MILLEWLIEVNFDLDVFFERILTEELKLLKHTSRSQLNRLNQILIEKNKPTINKEGFNELLLKLDTLIEERSLPF